MLTKVSAFHLYEHHDAFDGHETQCEFCLLAIDNQQAETLTAFTADLTEEPILIPRGNKIIAFAFIPILEPAQTELVSRPPPTTL